MSLRSRIVKIGNSKGIRIPATILEQLNLEGEVDIEVEGDHLIVRPAAVHPRSGWLTAFQAMAARGDDVLVHPSDPPSQWDREEWEW